MQLAAAPTDEATPIVETSNGASLPATFNLSVCWQHFFKPLANDRSLAPSGPSRRNMLGPVRVELTHSARGHATAAICAFETFERRLESTLSGRASGHSSRTACDGGSQIRFSSVCANRVRRPEDDDRSTRSYHPPLPHPRNRKRQLPLQEQLGESRQTRKGETSKLDERLTPKPSSSRVSSRWKSRVKSHRKLTQ